MKLQKAVAVAFLVSLGFEKAGTWEDEKLAARLKLVPSKVEAKTVDAKYADLYTQLEKLGEDGTVTLIEDEKAESADGEKPKANGKKEKPAAAAKKPAAKAKAVAKGKDKPAKAKKPAAETDKWGCKLGTVRASVNAALSSEFKTEEDIAKAAGVTLKQARIRLRRAKRKGLVEAVRSIQYRWKADAKKK